MSRADRRRLFTHVVPSQSLSVVDLVDAGDVEGLKAALAERPDLAGARGPDGVSLVLRARYRSRSDVVEALLASGPDLDVFDAAALGRIDVLGRLLEDDPSLVAERSPDGFTPLHLAAFFDQPEAARLLLKEGADPGAVSANAMAVQPLHSAVAGRSAAVVEALLGAGADPSVHQHGGWTPLHAAAQHGDADLVERLLAAGADPAAQADDGRTAAAMAAAAGHGELVPRLS